MYLRTACGLALAYALIAVSTAAIADVNFSDNPQGAPIKQAQVSAFAYVDGHWYDVHISKSGAERPDLAPLLDFLKTIAIN